MIIKASTADEVAAASNGGAYPPPQYHQQHPGVQPSVSSSLLSPLRRASRLERGDESPHAHASPPMTNNPYPPPYPASQSTPASGSMRSVAGGGSGSQVLLTTHVFAPVVTGAPTKKTKFPNTPGVVGEFLVFLFSVPLFFLLFALLSSFSSHNKPAPTPQFGYIDAPLMGLVIHKRIANW